MNFNSLIPELSVTNIDNSKKFYVEELGFRIMYERPENKFCFIEFESNQIMIEQVNNNWYTGTLEYPFGRGINLSMAVGNVEEYYQMLKEKGIIFFKELTINKYRVDNEVFEDKEFLIQDPDGYLLRFNN